MKTWQDTADPRVALAIQHKKKLKMPAVSIERLKEYKGPFISTLKMDGEHNLIFWNRGDEDVILVNSYGRFRTDLPVTKEFARLMNARMGFDSAVFAGELYAVNDDGSRMLLRHVMHHIKAPSNEQEEKRIRIALFDIVRFGDADVKDPYWLKIESMRKKTKDAKSVSTVEAIQGDYSAVKDMWDVEIVHNKMEGLVVHHPGGMLKIKDISTMDMVIVGMSKKGERYARGEAGSLLPAFMLPNGIFVIGSSVTVAVTSEQKDWYNWIMENKAGELIIENEGYVMCEPKRIMEIGAEAWYPYKEPKKVGLHYQEETGTWVKLGLYPAVTGQKPRFIKGMDGKSHERLDKTVNPDDLRLTQCPDFDEDWLLPYYAKGELAPEECPGFKFDWAKAKPQDIETFLKGIQSKCGIKSNPPNIEIPFKVVIKSEKEMGEYVALHGLVPGNELPDRFKGKIPKDEIWIRKDVYDDVPRRKSVLDHEEAELKLMTQQGLTYKRAHNRVERNPKWLTDKEIEEESPIDTEWEDSDLEWDDPKFWEDFQRRSVDYQRRTAEKVDAIIQDLLKYRCAREWRQFFDEINKTHQPMPEVEEQIMTYDLVQLKLRHGTKRWFLSGLGIMVLKRLPAWEETGNPPISIYLNNSGGI